MASSQSAQITEMYVGWAGTLVHPEQVEDRETDDSWGDLTTEPRGVDYVETSAGGGPAMWLASKCAPEDRVILALHGGGFVGGSMYTHRKLYGHVAKQAGVRWPRAWRSSRRGSTCRPPAIPTTGGATRTSPPSWSGASPRCTRPTSATRSRTRSGPT
jgi:hypothetical protein